MNISNAFNDKKKIDIKRIGLLDSGLGGLTVLAALTQKLPIDYIYLADTKNLPYGEKQPDVLCALSIANVDFLLTHDVDIIVIACHTLSAIALHTLKKTFPGVMFIGMLDLVCVAASAATKNGNIGIMATDATIKSNAHAAYIHQAKPTVQLIQQACPSLVPLIEQYPRNERKIEQAVKQYAEPLIKANIDTLILGCTHYSLIERIIEKQFTKGLTIIGADKAISGLLPTPLAVDTQHSSVSFFVTGDTKDFADKVMLMTQLPMPRLIQSIKI